ncbi:hypothetical protein BV20DRAFT_974917 [Pilatotrama ljubarskyi]|nr:hypothetical protein BV20DRAFT_974917 [Pilatotrama ljubarskyi]
MSSSSTGVDISALIAQYRGVWPLNTCAVAVATLVCFDTLLCLDQEVQLIWSNATSFASLVYMANRYMSVIATILAVTSIDPLSDKACVVSSWVATVFAGLSEIGPAVLASMRLYALSGRKKVLCGVTLVLSLMPFIINACTVYQARFVNDPPPEDCIREEGGDPALVVTLTCVARVSLIIADVLVAVMTWRVTYQSIRLMRDTGLGGRPSLHQTLLQSGARIAQLVLAALNTTQIILTGLQIVNPAGHGGYVTFFIDPLSSILNSRFVLNLRETNEKLSAGGSSVSQGTLHFADRPDSTQRPSFVDSLAGPVHMPETSEKAESTTAAGPSGSEDTGEVA